MKMHLLPLLKTLTQMVADKLNTHVSAQLQDL